jgi:hypothetical protein
MINIPLGYPAICPQTQCLTRQLYRQKNPEPHWEPFWEVSGSVSELKVARDTRGDL